MSDRSLCKSWWINSPNIQIYNNVEQDTPVASEIGSREGVVEFFVFLAGSVSKTYYTWLIIGICLCHIHTNVIKNLPLNCKNMKMK